MGNLNVNVKMHLKKWHTLILYLSCIMLTHLSVKSITFKTMHLTPTKLFALQLNYILLQSERLSCSQLW